MTNGFEAAYNYVRSSKPIPLVDSAFTEVLDSNLVINVFKGGARDFAKGDQCIGSISLELKKLVTGEKVGSTRVS